MPVRKRKIRAEKKTRRLVWITLVCACIAAAGVLYGVNQRENAVVDLGRNEDTSVTYQYRDMSEVAAVTVENETGSYTITQQNGAYALEGRPDFVFSDTLLDAVLSASTLIVTEETLLTLPEDEFKDYGLALGSIRVSVTYTDGTGIAFRIGSLIPQETPAYYFRVEGDNRLGVISQDVQETFSLSVNALHRVTDPAIKGDLIDRIAFTGENPFAMERRSDGWYLTAPFEYPLSTAAVNTVLKNLEGLRFSQYVSRAENADLAALGLSPARREMTLDIAPSILTGYDENGQALASQALEGYRLTFTCGDDIGDILFYCLYRGDVVKATRFSSGLMLTQSYEKLLLTQPVNIPTNLLTRLEWEANGQRAAYDVTLHERVMQNGRFETDESGNILYDVQVTKNGESLDADAFLLAYARLTDLKTTEALVDFAVPEDAQPDAAVRLYFNDSVREIAFYPCDALHFAVSVNGVVRYYVSRDALDHVNMP